MHETTISGFSTSGQQNQDFTIDNVPPGIYTLEVTKAVHTKFTVHEVVVGNDAVDLRLDSHPEVRLMTLRCGDINGDGLINDNDLTVMWMLLNYNRNVATAGNPLCDLDGDGMINDKDLTVLWLPYNYNHGEIINMY